jgi:hypothetical protein
MDSMVASNCKLVDTYRERERRGGKACRHPFFNAYVYHLGASHAGGAVVTRPPLPEHRMARGMEADRPCLHYGVRCCKQYQSRLKPKNKDILSSWTMFPCLRLRKRGPLLHVVRL